MNRSKLKIALIYTSLFSIITFLGLFLWILQLNREIETQLESGWFFPPTEVYSRAEPLSIHQPLNITEFEDRLKTFGYRKREPQQVVAENDYTIWGFDDCQGQISDKLTSEAAQCVFIKSSTKLLGSLDEDHIFQVIALSEQGDIVQLFKGQPLKSVEQIKLPPVLFAQFYKGEPIIRDLTSLSNIPLRCLQAITAIEDNKFLSHSGISVIGILRAFISNLLKGYYAQGGSTITQQLVKNYFLTPEKTIKRKVKEIFMSLLIEARFEKDKILENYLNVIYMGQQGPFQVRGFASASKYYFGKSLNLLDLHECALLSAIVNSPGKFDPFRNPDNAIERRAKVLQKMLDQNVIDQDTYTEANAKPLPLLVKQKTIKPAPYYTQAVFRELMKLELGELEGKKIFTSLSVDAQEIAQATVKTGVANLEGYYKNLKDNKDQGFNLQASLISIDLTTNEVMALVGGTNYRVTQYNRVLDAHRQVGSIMKPFVYLAALENFNANGSPYSPLTPLNDAPIEIKYDGQSWTPQNYSKDFRGELPLFFALKNSINAPTAQLGMKVGLENIIEVTKRAGITSEIKPFPSMTLGAFEIYPWELAQAYSTIARFGSYLPLTFINAVQDTNGTWLYKKPNSEGEQRFSKLVVSELISMLQQTIESGTAKYIRKLGFTPIAAGKTGTTSDSKDAWFMGFTQNILTIVWIGYDNNYTHGLTGATGAVPIWYNYMNSVTKKYASKDFSWPDNLVEKRIYHDQLKSLMPSLKDDEMTEPFTLRLRPENDINL